MRKVIASVFGVACAFGLSTVNAQLANPPSPQPTFGDRVAAAAHKRTQQSVVYDPAYRRIAYPGGDVPNDRGVCSDVVVRSLRAVGVDLQQLVHEDMRANFAAYPQIWSARGPDRNIDHRRVPNLETFFRRAGARLETSLEPIDYEPGDIVAWDLRADAGVLPHIGVVSDRVGPSGWPMVVHNIGAGPKLEDVLFLWPITGHYRIDPDDLSAAQSG